MAGGGIPKVSTAGLSRRSFLGAAGLVGGAAALAACSGNSTTGSAAQLGQGDDLVIGVSLELTGTGAVVGLSQRKAITIAQTKINNTGVVVGNQIHQVRVEIKDNASDPKQATQIAKDFAADARVLAIIGGCTAATAKAMAPIAEQQKIPLLATAAADTILRPIANRRFVFKLGPNASDVATVLTDAIARQQPKETRVALVAEAGDHGDTGAAAVAIATDNLQQDLVATVRVPVGAHSYQSQAEQVAAHKPDAVIVWSMAPTAGLVARALRAAGYGGHLYFDPGAASEDTMSVSNRPAAIDSYLVAPAIMAGKPIAVTTPAELDQVNFFEQYTQLYGSFSGVSVYGADALNLVVAAARRGRSAATRLRVRDELEAAPYDGIAGEYIFSTISHGGVQSDSLSLFERRRADWVKVG